MAEPIIILSPSSWSTGVDAANGLMAVKHLVFDDKKLTMAELKKQHWQPISKGNTRLFRKLCLDAPKHGNDIAEVNKLCSQGVR